LPDYLLVGALSYGLGIRRKDPDDDQQCRTKYPLSYTAPICQGALFTAELIRHGVNIALTIARDKSEYGTFEE
jgi:hypothetical protein